MSNKPKAFVLGMARSGYAAAKLLVDKGYYVLLNDAKAEQDADQIKELRGLGVEMVLGLTSDELLDKSFQMLIKNPGISNEHSYVLKAIELGIPVINEVELAYRYFPKDVKVIGVTGTNGKTTTVTLIYEILKQAKLVVHLMGNIGIPVCSIVPTMQKGDIAVMEISSYQLCNIIDFKTNISVMTNLSQAHIDFHGTYENYMDTKKRIFNNHTSNDLAVLNLGNQDVLNLTSDIMSEKKYFSSFKANDNGCSIIDNYICYNGEQIIKLSDIRIKGMHNYENAMAAIIVAKEFGVSNEDIITVLTTFIGVEHRIEYVKTINGREFYNDSKATNVKSTQIALASFEKPTILLLGGLDRGHSFDDLKSFLNHVIHIISYGETKNRINDFAKSCNVPCEVCETLEEATKKAYELSNDGDVILLSPSCASWDQFKDFEVRGKKFKEVINNLEGGK